jgi:hypothetical protein
LAKGKQPAKQAPIKKSTKGKQPAKKPTKAKKTEKLPKKPITMSLLTYKLHALGDYAQTIRQRGTTDSYNSQTVNILLYLELYLTDFTGRM